MVSEYKCTLRAMAAAERGVDHAKKIIRTIREIRNEHHSCTAREVARRLKLGHTLTVKQLTNLREAGLVDWTEQMGSVHLTMKGGKLAPRVKDDGQ